MAEKQNKAYLETEGGEMIHCLFNPTDLVLSQVNAWSGDVMPGRGVPTLRYSGAASGQLRLTLFFDTTDTGEAVTSYTAKIVKLMEECEYLCLSPSYKNLLIKNTLIEEIYIYIYMCVCVSVYS